MHADIDPIDVDKAIRNKITIAPSQPLRMLMWLFVFIGIGSFTCGLFKGNPAIIWASYYTSFIFFMGLACGSIIITAIWQIVRARWSPPLRRFAEANVAFLPWAFILFLITYFGSSYLFPWAVKGQVMPGREWWMTPDFVYGRFAVLFFILFAYLAYFVKLSLRADIALLREKGENKHFWDQWFAKCITCSYKGDPLVDQRKLSWNAPVLIFVYAVVFTMFSFEMLKGMDKKWISNLFGAFIFIGNIFIGWAMLIISTAYHSKRNENYNETIGKQQYWDLGKLTFAFTMLWGYFFFSQFLTQWYGNLPEETQWLIARTREFPWKGLSWVVFGACFVFPFVTLVGEDIKRVPKYLSVISLVILLGVWFERYIIVMPNISPSVIPFGLYDVGIFLGFLGVYVLSVQTFLKNMPFLPVTHPLSRNSLEW